MNLIKTDSHRTHDYKQIKPKFDFGNHTNCCCLKNKIFIILLAFKEIL